MSEEGDEEEAVKLPSLRGAKVLLLQHREERIERIQAENQKKRLEIRRAINKAGHEFFESMYGANKNLGYIAGEFMALNEEYVLNHCGEEETNATLKILRSGFTANQKVFLERLRGIVIGGSVK